MKRRRILIALACAAFGCGARDHSPQPSDARVRDDDAVRCSGDRWQLASGFTLSMPVDYVADRDDTETLVTLSSAGTACATAHDVASCRATMAVNPHVGRHLLTTIGDEVRVWSSGVSALMLLGAIDTPAEVLWWVGSQSLSTPCSIRIAREGSSYRIEGTQTGVHTQLVDESNCYRVLPDGGPANPTSMTVAADGRITYVWPDASQQMNCALD